MGWVKEVPPEQGNKIRLQMSAAGLPLDGMRWRILTFAEIFRASSFNASSTSGC